ncbi:hypothetical protein P0W64_01470 [Tsukamurella sp. 8F]|uniref:hypothetical protein n=1 Tax=unclassified Tsukamurella TaxID=2633480 RepID=UPI0023B8EA21|nr:MULTISPECIES: hypothetical protein [unclassified Tsukamurella]MDF0531093.1 hypothetical protein [Tsukamurella sp. 8J]MDF0585440.1 hypothetical protein [Tsukamurella sp. 8F]
MSRLMRIGTLVVVAVVAAAACVWGFTRGEPTPPPARSVDLDLSKLPDGPAPDRFGPDEPAAYSWKGEGDGLRPRVRGGRLETAPQTTGAAATYMTSRRLGAGIAEIGARWVFEAPVRPKGAAGRGAIALVVSDAIADGAAQPAPPFGLHLVVTAVNWNLAVKGRDAAQPLTVIAAGSFASPLAEDGRTANEIRVGIRGTTATIEPPDGTRRVVTDARIGAWRGGHATFETYANHGASDSRGAFERVWAHGER